MEKLIASIKSDKYFRALVNAVQGDIAALKNVLNAIEEGSLINQANIRKSARIVQFALQGNIPKNSSEAEINKTFKSIITHFVDYLDALIALRGLLLPGSSGIPITRNLIGEEEILKYVEEYIALEILRVSRNRDLTQETKLASFKEIDSVCRNSINSYFLVRNSLEHNKGVAIKDIIFQYLELQPLVANQVVDKLPYRVEAGQAIGIKSELRVKEFKKNSKILLTEEDIESVGSSIVLFFAPAFFKDFGAGLPHS